MLLEFASKLLFRFLAKPSGAYAPRATTDYMVWRSALLPGDVLLVEGNQRISMAIKYLTQSTWSHACLYVGETCPEAGYDRHEGVIVEADVTRGVIAAPLEKYRDFHTRICRPVNITDEEKRALVRYAIASLGRKYDLKNVFDLARYMLPNPPVPVSWRRKMLAFGSSDPTRAICSTLIAEAFESIGYPILPFIAYENTRDPQSFSYIEREIHHIRHYRLYAPRDFDLSPFFRIVKPTIEAGFDPHKLSYAGQRQPLPIAPAPSVP